MPLNPAGSTLAFTLSASGYSATVVIQDAPYSFEIIPFKRLEFSHQKLMDAKNLDGSKAQFQPNADGKPIQVQSNCATSPIRDPSPDDAVINSILKKFNVTEYKIEGAASSPSAVATLFTIAQDHKKKLLMFDAYLEQLSLDLSVQYLTDQLQPQTFSYLTATGLNMSGLATGSVTDVLITDFTPAALYRDTVAGTVVATGWSATVQKRTIAAQSSLA